MTIAMQNFGLTWTDPDGTPRASGVSYDRASADRRKGELEGGGCTGVQVIETRPGELPQPRG
jgi:hypothetical protein